MLYSINNMKKRIANLKAKKSDSQSMLTPNQEKNIEMEIGFLNDKLENTTDMFDWKNMSIFATKN